jgi:hypothetical protein
MAYIGKTPVIGNFQKCDSITVVNGQAAYTLQVGGTNVSPQSENHMLVSLNGILQAPTDSFTVSGSTLTFASNLVTGDVIDFVMILGNVLDLGVPSDNTVSLAKLTATGTKDATTFLRGDNTFDTPPLGGITEADHWRITSNFVPSSTSTTVINTNWERADGTGNGYFGTGMSQSSGIFTFPSTGYYLIDFVTSVTPSSNSYVSMVMQSTTNNSSYSTVLRLNMYPASGNVASSSGTQIIDVTDISNVKIRFATEFGNASSQAYGSSSYTYTGASFIRLGDT